MAMRNRENLLVTRDRVAKLLGKCREFLSRTDERATTLTAMRKMRSPPREDQLDDISRGVSIKEIREAKDEVQRVMDSPADEPVEPVREETPAE